MAEQLAKHGLPPPKPLQERPRLTQDDAYLVSQFLILHRTRGQSMAGPIPITLESLATFLQFWPQWDELRFIEIMLEADQHFLWLLSQDRKKPEADEAALKKLGKGTRKP